MIVRHTDVGWRVVFHAAHGWLAQQLAGKLRVDQTLPYWPLTQMAIGIHDDGKKPFLAGGRAYITETGAPKDFTQVSLDAEERVQDSRNQIWGAVKKHQWIGMLVSWHNEFIYGNEAVDDDMRRLLDEQADRRRDLLDRMGVSLEQVQQSYQWLRWCDRCSLILAGQDVPAMQRRIEIISDWQGTRWDLHQGEGETLHIDPWPFYDDRVVVSVEARNLKQLSFRDDAELAAALLAAPVVERLFEFERL